MLAVMVLDGAGYLLAVTSGSHVSPARVALLEDSFVAVAILTISVGLILPGMVAHSVTEVAEAARTLSTGTLADLSRAMDALGRGDLDEAWVSPTARPVRITSRDEVADEGEVENAFQMAIEVPVRDGGFQ